jgi:hypothetical protein
MLFKLLTGFALSALLACSVKADPYPSPYGPLYYPDGATITEIGAESYPGQFYYLDYSFADGTGVTFAPGRDGEVGDIEFSTPITAITFDYVWTGDFGFPFDVNVDGETLSYSAAAGTETVTFGRSVSGLQWIGGLADAGEGGITSLSYTEAPEPGSLPLAGIGIVALLAFRRRSRLTS